MKQIEQITTADFLTSDEISLIDRGYRHMVDNGYGKLEGVAQVLRVLAVHIEYARRELNWVTRRQFPSMVADAEAQIRGDEAMLRNLAARTGVI